MTMARVSRLLVALMLALPPIVFAHAADEPWILKLGVDNVDPKSNNGSLAGNTLAAQVGSSTRPTLTAEYLVTPNVGIELIAAWPFKHEVSLNGTEAATTEELPPTLSVQYHFFPRAQISPFIGIGLNYTRFFDVQERGPLAGTNLDLRDSWGIATHLGVDCRLNSRWLVGADVRWIDISTVATVNGTRVGTVSVDPWVFGAYVGFRL